MNPATEPVINPEARPLAREMTTALREIVQAYEQEEGLTTPAAVARIREDQLEEEQRALHGPPWHVSWPDLEGLLQRDPQNYEPRWEEIKRAAAAAGGRRHPRGRLLGRGRPPGGGQPLERGRPLHGRVDGDVLRAARGGTP